MSKRLSDTEALTRKGELKPAHNDYASEQSFWNPKGSEPAIGSADRAVDRERIEAQMYAPMATSETTRPARRETGAGASSLSQAVKICRE